MSILVTIMKGNTVVATQLPQTILNMLMGFAEHRSTVKEDEYGNECVHTKEIDFESTCIVKHGDYSRALATNIERIWTQKMQKANYVPE